MNPLFNMMPQAMGQNNPLAMISQIKQAMNGQNPQAFARMLAQKNPQFAQFLQENKGKSPEQIAQEHGLDFSQIKNFMK